MSQKASKSLTIILLDKEIPKNDGKRFRLIEMPFYSMEKEKTIIDQDNQLCDDFYKTNSDIEKYAHKNF